MPGIFDAYEIGVRDQGFQRLAASERNPRIVHSPENRRGAAYRLEEGLDFGGIPLVRLGELLVEGDAAVRVEVRAVTSADRRDGACRPHDGPRERRECPRRT